LDESYPSHGFFGSAYTNKIDTLLTHEYDVGRKFDGTYFFMSSLRGKPNRSGFRVLRFHIILTYLKGLDSLFGIHLVYCSIIADARYSASVTSIPDARLI
jgi:hypothetical protein